MLKGPSRLTFDFHTDEFAPVAGGSSLNTSLMGGSSLAGPRAASVASNWDVRLSAPAIREAAVVSSAVAPAASAAATAPTKHQAVVTTDGQFTHGLSGSPTLLPGAPDVVGGSVLDFTPTDTLYGSQWHFAAIGHGDNLSVAGTSANINNTVGMSTVWDEFTGAGVVVGVYDSGTEYIHPDLAGNYDASLHVVIDGVTIDGAPVHVTGDPDAAAHSTSVAGLIAASDDGVNGTGVAFGVTHTAVNIFTNTNPVFINAADPTKFYEALRWATDHFDVVNNSWGSTPVYGASQNSNTVGTFAYNVVAAFQENVEEGRGGLGVIVVKSAGNDNIDAGGESSNNSRFTLTVGSVSDDNWASSYSNYGFNLLVSAQGGDYAVMNSLGTWTTDMLGTEGYNLRSNVNANVDYTDSFGGTSSAAPIVSGVVALMLDANEGLGWRDVQNILAYSAHMTEASFNVNPQWARYINPVLGSPNTFKHTGSWQTNGADNWNGGGAHYNRDYGYGLIDAYNAVRMAEVWNLFGDAATSANEYTTSWTSGTLDMALADRVGSVNGVTTYNFTVSDDMVLEHLSFTVNLTHSWFGDLVFTLTSAEGTVMVMEGINSTPAATGLNWTFGLDSLRGENLAGDWTLTITDRYAGDAGVLHSITLDGFGTEVSADDVYHYTDEFFYAGEKFGDSATRAVLQDTDGGTDWVNAAAISGNLTLSLVQGATSTVFGRTLAVVAIGSDIENAVTGDGHDYVEGNALNNHLLGMRGNDSLFGLDGDDKLEGGAGDDILVGGLGVDAMIGGLGDDTYYVDDAGDAVTEADGEGTDTVRVSLSTYTLGDFIENGVIELASGAALTGNALDNALTGNIGADTLVGGDGNDVLNGLEGPDHMTGGLGDDAYYVQDSTDVVVELSGGGTDTVYSTVTFDLSVGEIENATLLWTLNRNLYGNDLDNILTGNSGNNILKGGKGGDTMIGGLGDDSYYVDSTRDVVTELADEGIDTVRSTISFNLDGTNVENAYLIGDLSRNLLGSSADNILKGNHANNIIAGKGGADELWGLRGIDTFDYNNVSESNATTMDVIMDLEAQDIIDLSGIDANSTIAANQAFTLVSAFSNQAGELRLEYVAGDAATYLLGDTDGDGTADLVVKLMGDHSGFTNFVL